MLWFGSLALMSTAYDAVQMAKGYSASVCFKDGVYDCMVSCGQLGTHIGSSEKKGPQLRNWSVSILFLFF